MCSYPSWQLAWAALTQTHEFTRACPLNCNLTSSIPPSLPPPYFCVLESPRFFVPSYSAGPRHAWQVQAALHTMSQLLDVSQQIPLWASSPALLHITSISLVYSNYNSK